MKVKFSRSSVFVPLFNGNRDLPEDEQLKYEISPMDNGDFYDMQDNITQIGLKPGADGKVDTADLNRQEQKKFVTCGKVYLPHYIKSVGSPLLDADGNTISIEDISKLSAFLSLSNELLWELFALSIPTEIEAKN